MRVCNLITTPRREELMRGGKLTLGLVPGVGGVRSVQSEPAHPSLNTPRFIQPRVMPSGRILSMNTSESLDETISRISVEDCGSDDRREQWSKFMMHRQTLVVEKINKMYEGMNKFSTAIHGAEAMFQELREDVGDMGEIEDG